MAPTAATGLRSLSQAALGTLESEQTGGVVVAAAGQTATISNRHVESCPFWDNSLDSAHLSSLDAWLRDKLFRSAAAALAETSSGCLGLCWLAGWPAERSVISGWY